MCRKANLICVTAIALMATTVFSVGAVVAQADRDTLLPDLAPRELEILGNLEITFPSLRRQPLTGFNPPPRIYEVPRGWRPWTGEYKQPSADIPGTSLIQPASPPTTISVGQHPQRGELTMGIGRYLSREVRAQATFDLGPSVVGYVDAVHQGLEKFKPFGDTLDTEAPHQTSDGLAGLTYRVGATSAGFELSGFFEELDIYGAPPDTSRLVSPERNGQGIGGRVWLTTGSASSVPSHVSAAYRTNTYETTRSGVANGPSIDASLLSLEAGTEVKMGDRALAFDGKMWIDGQSGNPDPANEPSSASSRDVTTYLAGSEMVFHTGDRSALRLGAQIHGYALSDAAATGADAVFHKSKLYVAPRVSLLAGIASGAEIYVKNEPVARLEDQRALFQVNPFLIDGPRTLPELSIINTEGGLVLYKGPLRVAARSGISMYESFAYFVSAESPVFGEGFFDVRYADADILFAGGDVGVTFPGRFSATLTGRWQRAKLDNDEDVPNYPQFEGGFRTSFVFSGDQGLLQFDGRFVGERNVDSTGSDVLPGYLDAAFLASYYLKNGVGFFARVRTITGEPFERWVGYPVADWVTLGGIRLRW